MRARAAAALAASLLLAPATGRAFERTHGARADSFVFWRYRAVEVRLARVTTGDLPPERVEAAVARAIDAWNDGGAPCSDLVLALAPAPAGTETSLAGGAHDGENRIVWREDEWPAELSDAVLAQTTLVYDARTGELLDADVDVNGVHHFWTDTEDPGRAVTDVENTITHELGHVVGLAHSPDPEATMFADAPPGDLTKRSLADDDVEGLCFVYPAGLVTPSAPGRAGRPLTGSCAAAPGTATPRLLAALAPLLVSRARRRGRSR